MARRIVWTACLVAVAAMASPARACMPPLLDPMLPGETQDAYRARTDILQRERAAKWLKERQTDDLQRADAVFVARDTWWSPPPRPRLRGGRPLPPKIMVIPYPAPSYFKPVDWFRGPRTRALFRVTTSNTSCGPMSIGDTTFSQEGKLFVFFARKGPLSEKTLIDAIAIDRIDDPVLMEFIAPHRGKPPAGPALSPR